MTASGCVSLLLLEGYLCVRAFHSSAVGFQMPILTTITSMPTRFSTPTYDQAKSPSWRVWSRLRLAKHSGLDVWPHERSLRKSMLVRRCSLGCVGQRMAVTRKSSSRPSTSQATRTDACLAVLVAKNSPASRKAFKGQVLAMLMFFTAAEL